MQKKKIGIVGYGYVGKAMYNFFKDHFDVIFYDPNAEGSATKEEINACDMGVVSVPTPMGEGGKVDLSIINETVDWLNTPVILIKSTIPPTTTAGLVARTGKKIVFSPEYVGEGKYVVQWWKDKGYPHPTDMKYHDFQIFGGEREATIKVLSFFKKVLGPEPRYFQVDSTTAEVCKYMENSWGFTKVMFCNEFFDIAKAFGVDYNELREIWLADGRVERMHTAVFDEDRAVGGKCFPKDVNGIVIASEEAGANVSLLKAVLKRNDEIIAGKTTK